MAVRLQILGSDGRRQSVTVEAATEAEAIRRVVASGARVLAVESADIAALPKTGRAQPFPLLLFSQELLALLSAGLNLTEAITTLVAKEQKPQAKQTLAAVLQALHEGRNFSDALAQHGESFPDMFIATVRASERTGGLVESLSRYIAYALQFEAIRKKLVSAAIYPAMLLFVGSLVTLFLLGYVVPKFSVVYESSGRDLPLLSQVMLAFGRVLHAHWQPCLVAFVGLVAAAVWALRQAELRQRLLEGVLSLPWLAAQVSGFRLTRFYRGVSLLLHAGVPLSRALRMVANLLSPAQRRQLAEACRQVDEGQMLSSALVRHGLAGVVAESLLQVGERSGRLAEMLEQAARFQDEEFARWLDLASRLLEPVLMAVIGIVIGVVVVLLYMPIFELAGSLS